MITNIVFALLVALLPVCAEEDSTQCVWTSNEGVQYITWDSTE